MSADQPVRHNWRPAREHKDPKEWRYKAEDSAEARDANEEGVTPRKRLAPFSTSPVQRKAPSMLTLGPPSRANRVRTRDACRFTPSTPPSFECAAVPSRPQSPVHRGLHHVRPKEWCRRGRDRRDAQRLCVRRGLICVGHQHGGHAREGVWRERGYPACAVQQSLNPRRGPTHPSPRKIRHRHPGRTR